MRGKDQSPSDGEGAVRVPYVQDGHPFFGRKKRPILCEAAFSWVIASPTFVPAGAQGTPEETRTFAAGKVAQIRQPSFDELVTSQDWADAASREAMATAVLDRGERPDASAASLGDAAVG